MGVFSSASISDLAVDDLSNNGAIAFTTSIYGGGQFPIPHSSKSLFRVVNGGAISASTPQFLFAANSNGKVDVIDLQLGAQFVRPITVPGAQVLCSYWRQ